MPALSTRHIASSALCAALLVGITGPAALAADPAHERGPTASHDTRLSREDALLEQVRKVNGGELAPVADLLEAVLKADHGRLSAAEAGKLGAAAKSALAKALAGTPGTGVLLPASTGSAAGLMGDDPEDVEDVVGDVLDDVDDVLGDVQEAVDRLLEGMTSGSAGLPLDADDLLAELEDLIASLPDSAFAETASSEQTTSTTQTTQTTQTPEVARPQSAVTLPWLEPLTKLLSGL